MQLKKGPSLTEQDVLGSIRQIVKGLHVSSREAEREHRVSLAQLFVLQILSFSESLTINELAERTQTHQSSVSTVVSRLESAGLISRAPSQEDARRVEVAITKRGQALVSRAQPLAQEHLLDAVRSLGTREQKELSRLLTKVAERAGFSRTPPPLFFEDSTETRASRPRRMKKRKNASLT